MWSEITALCFGPSWSDCRQTYAWICAIHKYVMSSGGITPLILKLGNRERWLVRLMPRQQWNRKLVELQSPCGRDSEKFLPPPGIESRFSLHSALSQVTILIASCPGRFTATKEPPVSIRQSRWREVCKSSAVWILKISNVISAVHVTTLIPVRWNWFENIFLPNCENT
jgi:hypothetical protein